MDDLRERFSDARLSLEVLSGPIFPTDKDIFQMDVEVRPSGERFRVWPGHSSNSVEVVSVDRKLRQVVLVVRERARFYQMKVSKRSTARRNLADALGSRNGRLVKETASNYVLECRTSSSKRRYLCGFDESHLFIAEFEKGTTVADAHESLKPDDVRRYEEEGLGPALRQGEWFFVRLNEDDEYDLKDHLESGWGEVLRGWPLGDGGRPHLAEKVVQVRRDQVYARGSVSHDDHATLELGSWHRVFRNAEVMSAQTAAGVYWID